MFKYTSDTEGTNISTGVLPVVLKIRNKNEYQLKKVNKLRFSDVYTHCVWNKLQIYMLVYFCFFCVICLHFKFLDFPLYEYYKFSHFAKLDNTKSTGNIVCINVTSAA